MDLDKSLVSTQESRVGAQAGRDSEQYLVAAGFMSNAFRMSDDRGLPRVAEVVSRVAGGFSTLPPRLHLNMPVTEWL